MLDSPSGVFCCICGEVNPYVLESHHVIPRRYGGSDNPQNLIKVCGSCHNALERIYDDEFYTRISNKLNTESIQDTIGLSTTEVRGASSETPTPLEYLSKDQVEAVELRTRYHIVKAMADAGITQTQISRILCSADNIGGLTQSRVSQIVNSETFEEVYTK